MGHAFDRYQNGTMSTVGWDDTGGDRDFNDMTLEVAVVFRRDYFLELDPVALDRYEREIAPRLRRSLKRAPSPGPR